MTNHLHLVVETPQGNLVAGMKWLLGTYTMRFNARHQLRGHLFAGRYQSLIIDDRDLHYLRRVSDYVHLNPVRVRQTFGCARRARAGMNFWSCDGRGNRVIVFASWNSISKMNIPTGPMPFLLRW